MEALTTTESTKTIEEKFSQIFKYMGLPKDQLRKETSFVKDFDFGEFQFTCLAFYIGAYFKINFKEEDYETINTIGDAIDFVKKKFKVS